MINQDFIQLESNAKELVDWAIDFQKNAREIRVAQIDEPQLKQQSVATNGMGFDAAFDNFKSNIAPYLSASVGPRYLGFVTGGTTPAAMLADWLVTATDQNVSSSADSIATAVEIQTLEWLCEMFALPNNFDGIITTGATVANILGALAARQHAGQQQGLDIARDGFCNARLGVFAATPHASMVKAMAIAGFGRNKISKISCLKDSEAMDVNDLAEKLAASGSEGKIVIASAGTVTGTDFDDLAAIADLCEAHDAWLHVDAAFGLFTRMISQKRDLTRGIERADSITTDSHKWLNVPYGSGVFLTRHIGILQETCSVAAPYLDLGNKTPDFMDRGLENSRRFRALPIWMALQAYGVEGHRSIVESNCRMAKMLADWIEQSDQFELLHPCQMNVVIFRPSEKNTSSNSVVLNSLNQSGRVFLTPGQWGEKSGIRAAFSNWRTRAEDVAEICKLLDEPTSA